MTTSSERADPSAQPEPAGMNLLSEQARATVEENKAENEALEEANQVAEAQAEVVAEQARQLVEATEEVLEELREASRNLVPPDGDAAGQAGERAALAHGRRPGRGRGRVGGLLGVDRRGLIG